MPNTFKKNLLALWSEAPHLRDALDPILTYVHRAELAQGLVQAPEHEDHHADPHEYLIPVPSDVPKPAQKVEDSEFFSVGPAAQKAFEAVLLKQLNVASDIRMSDIPKIKEEVAALGTSRNPDLDAALLVYKPVSVGTKRFYAEVQRAFDNWVAPKLDAPLIPSEGSPSPSGDGSTHKYNITFS